jgi:exo-beta-1,3-glucanase (GH17 family)
MAYFGVCYSPYRIGSPGNWKGLVTEATVKADMQTIVDMGFTHIRTYGVDGGNQWNVAQALARNLSLGLGVWMHGKNDPNWESWNKAQVDLALDQVNGASNGASVSLDLVIGNEVDRTDNDTYTEEIILKAMEYAKESRKRFPNIHARVTTCFSGTVAQNTRTSQWTNIIQKVCEDVVYLTVYPWYGQCSQHTINPANIDPQMDWSYNSGGIKNVTQWAFKEVVIAEIGWPSAGKPECGTTVDNERINFSTTKNWMATHPWNKGNTTFNTFWFSMFDEPWKSNEGGQGPYWGLCDKDGNRKW